MRSKAQWLDQLARKKENNAITKQWCALGYGPRYCRGFEFDKTPQHIEAERKYYKERSKEIE